jgi:predicted Zn-dependent protease
MDFVKNTDDTAAAANSAKIVFKNAEDSNLISQAAKYLGKDIADINSIPILDKNETGLQLILVPLHPCNPWLLEEAAATFRQITDIPVKIRRLKEDWKWANPERIPYERTIQSRLVRLKETDIDFTGWTKDRYIEEMRKAVETKDALSKYYVNNLIRKIKSKQGQYSVGPYLTRFSGILASYRGADKRTMYVGITETNIYSGDENFLFSQGGGESQASILSYYMMLSRTLDEEYQSRQRLTERIAKELVPASLKQLNIPRSTDPTCPYSYSSGVTRLDQKTLKLSELVKQALDKLKDPAKTSDAPK